MYDELVNSLRICGKISSADDYCVAFHDGCCEAEPVCMYELMMKAADAIEELQATVEGYESSTNMALVEENGKTVIEFVPKWIPVTERLPEKYHQVLVYGLNGIQIDYYAGEKSIGGRPLFMISEAKVTHWQPLPEPPEEE